MNQIEHGLRERIAAADPTFLEEPARGIVLSFCVHGCYYAFMNNNNSECQMDEKRLVALLGAIARATLNIEILSCILCFFTAKRPAVQQAARQSAVFV